LPNLLIVAPSPDLRQSLTFAFESEGYEVVAVASLGDPRPQPDKVDCIVLDHHATDASDADALDFCARYTPIVLLANYAPHKLSSLVFRTVQKPLLGPTLSFAVRVAVSSRGNTMRRS
jgi:CheY-like chemotaxis protein